MANRNFGEGWWWGDETEGDDNDEDMQMYSYPSPPNRSTQSIPLQNTGQDPWHHEQQAQYIPDDPWRVWGGTAHEQRDAGLMGQPQMEGLGVFRPPSVFSNVQSGAPLRMDNATQFPDDAYNYGGLDTHGTLEEFQFAVSSNMDPRTYAQGNVAPAGPPRDQVRYEATMSSSVPETPSGGGPRPHPPRRRGPNLNPNPNPNQRSQPFAGHLSTHPEWWGTYFDDGVRKPGESLRRYGERVRRAQANMQIESRDAPALPPGPPGQDPQERALQVRAHNGAQRRAGSIHKNKLDRRHRAYDPQYEAQWRADKASRKARNDQRRREELQYARGEYSTQGLPRPDTPGPPDSSGDELYQPTIAATFQRLRRQRIANDGNREVQGDDGGGDHADSVEPEGDQDGSIDGIDMALYREKFPNCEANRCVPCLVTRTACSYSWKVFPCDACVTNGTPEACIRQRWAVNRHQPRPLYLPSRATRAALGDQAPRAFRGASVTIYQLRPGGARQPPRAGSVTPTPSSSPCDRCQQRHTGCSPHRPCTACIDSGEAHLCDASIRDQPFTSLPLSGGDDDVIMGETDPHLPPQATIQPSLLGMDPQNIASSAAAPPLPRRILPARGARRRPRVYRQPRNQGHQEVHPEADTSRTLKRKPTPEEESARKKARVVKESSPRQEVANTNAALVRRQTNLYQPANPQQQDTLNLLNDEDVEMHDGAAGGDGALDYDFDFFIDYPSTTSPGFGGTGSTGLPPAAWSLIHVRRDRSANFGRDEVFALNNNDKCTERLNYWDVPLQEFGALCLQAPAKVCDDLRDDHMFSDQPCHQNQNQCVAQMQYLTTESTRMWCCQECGVDIRSNDQREESPVRIGECLCVGQMTKTWLCNDHRREAIELVKARAAVEEEQHVRDGTATRCPRCGLRDRSWESGCWKCKCCLEFVLERA